MAATPREKTISLIRVGMVNIMEGLIDLKLARDNSKLANMTKYDQEYLEKSINFTTKYGVDNLSHILDRMENSK